jgi:hypothetical protein
MWVGTRVWLNRRRARNAPLRREVEAQVCYATTLDGARIRRESVFAGTRGQWTSLQGPRRLIVGTDAFIFSAPNALREFYFRGRECSITFSQAPSRLVSRDWIVITGQADGRLVQLAIARVLAADAAAWLGAIALPWLGDLGDSGFLVAMVMFVVWFYRARVNAEGHGWPQRRSPGAAIWSWFVPAVNLFAPFQIMADIWRAGLPAQARANPATLPGTWWGCMLAFFLLSSFLPSAGTGSPADPAWYAGMPVKISGVLAAIMTALLVQKVSSGPRTKDGAC